jgi:Ni,Fe-hydrogenase maturation factor
MEAPRGWRFSAVSPASTAHESSESEFLAASALIGECPKQVVVIGIEPYRIATGTELSEPVVQARARAIEAAREALMELSKARRAVPEGTL